MERVMEHREKLAKLNSWEECIKGIHRAYMVPKLLRSKVYELKRLLGKDLLRTDHRKENKTLIFETTEGNISICIKEQVAFIEFDTVYTENVDKSQGVVQAYEDTLDELLEYLENL